jgi:hypothetical protein
MDNKKTSFLFKSFKTGNVRKYGRPLSLFLILAVINLMVGCTYYKVTSPKSISQLEKEINTNSKFFIVHLGDKAWRLKNIALNDEDKTMTGNFETLAPEYHQYLKTNVKGNNRYKPQNSNVDPTYQVHFYISEYADGDKDQVVIPLSGIKKIEMYDKAKGANTASYVFGTIGVLAAIFVVITIVVLLFKSSCPFVYVKEGETYTFAGEMYGGAIYSSLERDDYMPLPFSMHSNGEYDLKITNELLERQYTNLAELIVVEHPANHKVLLDKNGAFHSITKPEPPVRAISDKIGEYLHTVSFPDSNYYMFNNENKDNPDLSNLTLTFNKPINAKKGKLILNLKNSYWLDYSFGKFNEQFGTYYNEFAEKQKDVPAQKMNQWSLDQNIPLSVYVQANSGWEYRDNFQVIGPLASRDVVMSLDLSGLVTEQITIKLESGFMFWELDYAAMDFTENIPIDACHVNPSVAVDQNGKDVSKNIASSDQQYLVQPNVGDEANLKFIVPGCGEEMRQTFFLHSRGYYEYIRDYQNKPDYLKLYSFKKKGSFTRFSKEQYYEFAGDSFLLESTLTDTNGK